MDDETLIYYGDVIKALGDGKVAGYLVRFGNPKDTDLERDFFSKETDLGVDDGATVPVYYQHGYDSKLKSRRIGRGVIKYDDAGAWLEAQLEMRDEYERMLYEMAEAGKLGWSSGAAGHLVEREPVGKAWHIKTWVIGEASLTPTPAEPRNSALPLKSLFNAPEQAEDSPGDTPKNKETTKMEPEEIKALVESAVKSAAEEAVKRFGEEVKAGYNVEVVEDEADRALKGNPFKSGEFFMAVKNAAVSPHDIDKRLLPLKSTGLNEAVPSQGGFLVQSDVSTTIMQNVWSVGSLLSRFTAIPVSGNGLTLNAIDETSRADGSRMGGVQGYWIEEGGTKLASKPKFRQINLKLKKVATLCYATDELLEDATALGSWVVNNVPGELRFKVEDSIMNSVGVGTPRGILTSPALIQVTRTDANEIDSLDITRMWAARYIGATDYVWLINANVTPQLYNMTLGTQPIYLPPGGLSASPYGQLMGRPVIETEYNPGLGSVGDILLASPSQYAMITKGGVQAASSIHVQFVTDETAFRFVYRVDGEPYWASPVTVFKGAYTVSPFVALAATT